VIVWDIWGGRALRTFQVADLELVDARFSPDGTAIIASNEVGASESLRLTFLWEYVVTSVKSEAVFISYKRHEVQLFSV
jgi:hypothetical protein